MSDDERKTAMAYLGVAPLKTEGGWMAADGSTPTPDQIREFKARQQEKFRRRDALERRWKEAPAEVDRAWIAETAPKELELAWYDARDEMPWTIIRWIAEGRIRDANGVCAEAIRSYDKWLGRTP